MHARNRGSAKKTSQSTYLVAFPKKPLVASTTQATGELSKIAKSFNYVIIYFFTSQLLKCARSQPPRTVGQLMVSMFVSVSYVRARFFYLLGWAALQLAMYF